MKKMTQPMGGVHAGAADARAVYEGMPYSFPTNTSREKNFVVRLMSTT